MTALLLLALAADPRPLFPADGPPAGWTVRKWNDLSQSAGPGTEWTVKGGVLRPGQTRGTWLVSEAEYGDFALEFEIKLTERGNSGVALRAPMKGDPAFDGMEFQVADLRYNPKALDSELTAGIYRAVAPTKQAYKPLDWNRVRIELRGAKLVGTVNGETVQDIDLSTFDKPVKRHDGSDAPPVKDRPRRGHIGFQHLSRNNEPVEIRGAKLEVFDLASGVPVGKRPGPYSFLVATGPERGKQTCYICEQADKPACVVFARRLTPELGKLLAGLDAEAARRSDGFKAWLTILGGADLDAVARWCQQQGVKLPAGVFERADGPPAYTLHPDAEVTALVFTREKVTANLSSRGLTTGQVGEVLRAVGECK